MDESLIRTESGHSVTIVKYLFLYQRCEVTGPTPSASIPRTLGGLNCFSAVLLLRS